MSTHNASRYKSNRSRMIRFKKLEEKLTKLRSFKELMVFCKRIITYGYFDILKMTLKKMFKISKDTEESHLLYQISPPWSGFRELAKKKADLLFNKSMKKNV